VLRAPGPSCIFEKLNGIRDPVRIVLGRLPSSKGISKCIPEIESCRLRVTHCVKSGSIKAKIFVAQRYRRDTLMHIYKNFVSSFPAIRLNNFPVIHEVISKAFAMDRVLRR
jgi:hypothetical protein